jgi:hypothetical protein
MNANELPGPSTTVLVTVFDGGTLDEGDAIEGDGEGVGVGVVFPFVDADALLPHAAATSPSPMMPIRSACLPRSLRIS